MNHSLRHLNTYFLKYKYRLVMGFVFVALSNVFAIFPAQVVKIALDLLKEKLIFYRLTEGFGIHDQFRKEVVMVAFLFAVLILILAFIKGIFMFFMRQTIIVMSRLIEYDLKNEIFEHYQKLNVSFYRRNNTGDLMARISEDVSRVRMYIGPAIMYTVNLTVLSILVIGTMLSVNARLTAFVLIPLPILAIAIYFVSTRIENLSDTVQTRLSSLSTFVQEAFSGIRVLQSYVREPSSEMRFGVETEQFRKQSLELARVNALFFPIIATLVGMSLLITIYAGGLEVIAGRASIGTIAEFIYYVNMLTWPFASVGWVTSLIQRASASQNRINEFLKTEPEIQSDGKGVKEFKGDIEFRNVSYRYSDTGIEALKNISFQIKTDESLAVVGKTGCGKSTIAGLMLRLFDADTGEILIDGKNIKEYDLNKLREYTGYVPQDVFLFSDSIANNISFGLKDGLREREKTEQAAKDAGVYENIMQFKDGFETVTGERGITLSGGQKQRISIARAIIKAPRILIFDDCLSAVDTHTEEQILRNLKRIMKDRTSILISHRISTVKDADHILVLDEGRITERGNHSGLLEQQGMYASMHQRQLLESEEETGEESLKTA